MDAVNKKLTELHRHALEVSDLIDEDNGQAILFIACTNKETVGCMTGRARDMITIMREIIKRDTRMGDVMRVALAMDTLQKEKENENVRPESGSIN